MPSAAVGLQTWSHAVPQGLKDEVEAAATKLFGNWIEDMRPVDYRMCW